MELTFTLKRMTTTTKDIQLELPPIIYGTSFLGNLYKELSKDEKLNLIREWFRVANGIVLIDSAGKYGAGLALETIGSGLKELGVKPSDILISNKLGWYRVPLKTEEPTFEPGAWVNLEYDAVQRINYQGILDCWEQGCELLGDYKPQLVSVHDPDEYLFSAKNENDYQQRVQDIKEAYKALFELKEKGEVKAVGIGSKDWKTIQLLYNEIPFDWVMFANAFTVYRHPKEIVSFMQQLDTDGVTVINSAIFNAGFLTGGAYFDYRILEESNPKDQPMFEWRKKFFKLCEQFHLAPGDVCLKFALSPKFIKAVALNPSKPKRMKHNNEVLKMEFPKAFWQAMKSNGLIDPDYTFV